MAAFRAGIARYQIWLLLFGGFLLCFFLVLIPALVTAVAPSSNLGAGMRIILGHSPYDRPMTSLERTWNQFRYLNYWDHDIRDVDLPKVQGLINDDVKTRLENLESRVAAVETALQLNTATLEEMYQMLPKRVVLEIIDGQPSIPADFWTALQARVAENSNLAPAWQAWVLRNEEQLSILLANYADSILDDRVANGQIVRRDAFVQALDDQNNFLMAKYKEEVLEFSKQQSAIIKELAQSTFDAAAEKNPTADQLRALLHIYELHNSYRSTHSINWFSSGLGARVNPHFTSVTKGLQSKGWLNDIFRSFNPINPNPMPPIAALSKWEEATECWCGTPGDDEHVQIGIITPLKFHPTHLIIEHIPQSATLDGDAAPGKIEAWVDLGSREEAKRVRDLYETQWWTPNADACGQSPPGDNWICALTGEYSIENANYIQAFPFWIEAVKDNIAVNKVVVRAVSNHGAPYTCFYRLRAEGVRMLDGQQ